MWVQHYMALEQQRQGAVQAGMDIRLCRMEKDQQQTHEEVRKCFAEQTNIFTQQHHILYERIDDIDSRVSKGAGKGARQMWHASVTDSRAAQSSCVQASCDFVSRYGGTSISEAPAFQLEDGKRRRVEQHKAQTVLTRKQADAARKIEQDAENKFFAWLAASKRRNAEPGEVKALEDAADAAMQLEFTLEQHTPCTPTEVVHTSDIEALALPQSAQEPASPELVASSVSAELVAPSSAAASEALGSQQPCGYNT